MLQVGQQKTHVLIFSGGYDNINDIRDDRADTTLADSHGRAIFIVNAISGAYIDSFDSFNYADAGAMIYSIPSTPRVVDINFDNLADYLFVGDTGGQIWRLDFDNQPRQAASGINITGGVIADLSDDGPKNNRRFFYEPDIAVLKDKYNKQYLNIAIGSGWRASPLNAVVEDRMYVIRDNAIYGPPRDDKGVVTYNDASTSDTSADTTTKSLKGYYIKMQEPGEKIVSTAFTINSNLLFTSYLPGEASSDACQAAVGASQFYAIDARNGKSILNLDGSISTTAADNLDLDDRSIKLKAPGIAPGPAVFIPHGANPVVVVGLEEPEGSQDLDIGKRYQRTFWANPENFNE